MTKYSIKHYDDKFIIEIKGHANYSEQGSDIVCSAVSTAIYMTRNVIEQVEPGYNLSNIKLEEGYAYFEVDSKYKYATKVLIALEFALNDLGDQYPDYIKQIK